MMPGTLLRLLRARTVALAVLLAAALAPVARAADPIMPLDQVQRGMHCTGMTVLRGTDISSFDVEVLDVVAGRPPEDPRILIRVSGAVLGDAGIAEGFSGSPVYCGGRNIGAISETLGQYGETVGLVTPIEQMLGLPADPPVTAQYDPRLLASAKPLRGMLTVTGVSGPLGRALEDKARREHREFLAVPPGPLGTFPPQPLVPGASVSAGYSSGDLAVGAIGTVTYTDGDLVYAFGHPFDSAGRRALLLEDAFVYAVIANPLDIDQATSYKLAAPGHALGTLSNDTPNGVVGHVGTLPDTATLTVDAKDGDTGAERPLSADAVDEAAVGFPTGISPLGLVADLGLLQQATTILNGTPARETGDMCVRVLLRIDDKPLRFCNRYVVQDDGTASSSGDMLGPLAPLAADDMDQGLNLIQTAAFADLGIRSVDVSLRLRRGLHLAEIESARALTPSVRRGGRLRLRLRTRILRGPARTFTFSTPVPHSLKPGRHELHIKGSPLDDVAAGASEVVLEIGSGGGGDDSGSGDSSQPPVVGPSSMDDLRSQFRGLGRYDGVAGAFTGGRGRFALYRNPDTRIDGSASVPFRVR
jgi:hypothetical protein